jgi:peptidase E
VIDTSRPGWLRVRSGAGAVVAYGGGGRSAGGGPLSPVERALLHGVVRPDGAPPVVCLVPTAGGDADAVMDGFRQVFSDAGAEPHVLSLFRRTEAPFADVLDRADLVYVTGGAVANLAALWRLHGLDVELVARWRRGLPVAGSSAGALIWGAGGVTTSFGAPAVWTGGLRALPLSLCPHADTQPERAALYRAAVEDGRLPPGYALDDRAAAVFVDGRLAGVLGDDEEAAVTPVGPRDPQP